MDGDSGPGVGSARSVVQAGGVGMTMFGVAEKALVGSATDGAQEVMKRERIKRGRKKEENFCMFDSVCSVLHAYLMASWSCSKEVIQAMALMKSSRESLCSRSARTAGPTGSSPAAPPVVSAYAT